MDSDILVKQAILIIIFITLILYNTYIVVYSQKTKFLICYLALEFSFILWLFGKFMELVSPNQEIQGFFIALQKISLLGLFFSKFEYIPILIILLFQLYIATFGNKFFCNVSMKHINSFVSNLKDSIFVFDLNGILIDKNSNYIRSEDEEIIISLEKINSLQEFLYILQLNIDEDCKDSKDFKSVRDILSKSSEEYNTLKKEITFVKGIDKMQDSKKFYFTLGISPILSKKNRLLGRVFIFHDISSEKNLAYEIEKKNLELEKLNNQLYDYISIANRVEEEKERSRIAFEINSTIGHNIIELLATMEVINMNITSNSNTSTEELKLKLTCAIDKCREILAQTRESVNKLLPK
jgi:signal transduction histidine kinase